MVVIGIIGYTFMGEETTVSEEDYATQIDKEREEKDKFFKTSPESPIEDKATFVSLPYYLPNPDFKVNATVEPYKGADKKVNIPMTDGSTQVYEKFGYANFKIDNKAYKLLIYKHDGGLSVLFKDATAPAETYGGGRYLDIKESDITANKMVIDFNKAYNPYCAFNHTFACPLPPKENTLPIRIEAGEKKP